MTSLNETWAELIDEVIKDCPKLNFKSRAEVIRYCLREQLPKIRSRYIEDERGK